MIFFLFLTKFSALGQGLTGLGVNTALGSAVLILNSTSKISTIFNHASAVLSFIVLFF